MAHYPRIAALCISIATLSACTHTEPGIEIRTVEVPVAVACLPADEIPQEPPLISDRLTGDPARDIGVIAASALKLRVWGRQMEAALRVCAAND